MPENAANQRTYSSVFHHGVDEKRRVQIPAKWRPGEPETELTLMVWRNPEVGACVRVLPPARLAKFFAELDKMPNSPKKTAFMRLVGGNSAQVTLDKAGRICLPEEMTREAGITDQAVLVGLLDHFEIWCPQRHKAVQAVDDVLATEAYSML